jgi:hypothetical protein
MQSSLLNDIMELFSNTNILGPNAR